MLTRTGKIAGAGLLAVSTLAAAQEQTPQAVPDAQARPGETLTERLDRTDGVIKPPPVDAPMQREPPPETGNMPIIKPPAPQQKEEPAIAR